VLPKVLLFVSNEGEIGLLQDTLTPHVELTQICDPGKMARELASSNFDVMFCSRELGAGNWRDVLEKVRKIDSNLPVIVVSEGGDEAEWEEVLAAGAFDLLSSSGTRRSCFQ